MMEINTARVTKRGKEMLELYRCVYKEQPIIDRTRLLDFSGFYTWAGITGKLKNFSEKLENDVDRLDFISDIEFGLRTYYEMDVTQLLELGYLDLLLSFPYTTVSSLGMLTRDSNQGQRFIFSTPESPEAVRDRLLKFDIHDETDKDGYNKAILRIKQGYLEIFKDYIK